MAAKYLDITSVTRIISTKTNMLHFNALALKITPKNTKNKVILEFRKFLLSDEFIVFLEKITGLKFTRNKFDMHSLKLENTHYLLCHDDRVDTRKLAFVINFSDFEEKDGGALEFFKMNLKTFEAEVFESVIPKFSKFNIFEVSEKSYHQITEVVSKKKRVTIGGWYHE